jgi:hypothetical protein
MAASAFHTAAYTFDPGTDAYTLHQTLSIPGILLHSTPTTLFD